MDWHILIPVFNIIMIDLLLGGDNAVVIALACRNLPYKERKTAILYGTALAVIVRIFMTAIIMSLLKTPYILALGGGCLIILAVKLIVSDDENVGRIKAGSSVMRAIRTIVAADIIMGLDNVLGIAGIAKGNLLLVVLGLMVSVPMIVFGSRIVLRGLEAMPWLVYIGGGILAYTGSDMLQSDPKLQNYLGSMQDHTFYISLFLMTLSIFIGLIINMYKKLHVD